MREERSWNPRVDYRRMEKGVEPIIRCPYRGKRKKGSNRIRRLKSVRPLFALFAWVRANLADHLSKKQRPALRDGLESVLQGHDRREGQMAYPSGEST